MRNNWKCKIVYNNQTKQTFYFDTEWEVLAFSNDMLRWKKQLGISFTAIQEYSSFLGAIEYIKMELRALQTYSKYNVGPSYLNRGKEFAKKYKRYQEIMAENREWQRFLVI